MRSKAFYVAAVLLAGVAIYPPVERYSSASGQELTANKGFMFIWDVGVQERIRQSQWLTELGVAAAIGILLIAAGRKS